MTQSTENNNLLKDHNLCWGLPWWFSSKESAGQCRWHGFDPNTGYQEDPLEKEMATLASILSWEIPWTEEPGRLQPMGSRKVGHDLVTK